MLPMPLAYHAAFLKKGSGNIYSNEELQEMERIRQQLVSLHSTTAQKLSKRMANECLLSDEEIQNHNQRRLNICKKMRTAHYGKRWYYEIKI